MSEQTREQRDHDHVDRRLDEALEESFPASDPPAVSLKDDPPLVPHALARDADRSDPATRPRRLVRRILAGGALAAAGVFVTRMILRRSPKRRMQ